MPVLNAATLATLAASSSSAPTLVLPRYDRGSVQAGVVHLGLGAFHRAHQAMVFDHLLQAGDKRWGVLGVAMRSTELADALAAQDGLYAVQVASAEGLHWQVVGALRDTCVAAREPAKVVAAKAAPATRWVTLTVTEKAYGPALAELLVQGLAARRAAVRPSSCRGRGFHGVRGLSGSRKLFRILETGMQILTLFYSSFFSLA